jgi:uncharacterized protein (TIRG00374 family)
LDRKIKHAIKILITIGLLLFVIYSANPFKIYEVLKGIIIWFFLLAILVGIFNNALSSKKWQILLEVKGEKHRFRDVLKIYYTGVFFNIFLPTSIGGDVVKAYEMSKISKKRVEAYSSVFMERFTGGVIIIILALIATTIYFDKLPIEIPILVYCFFTPIFLISLLLITRKKIVKKFRRFYSVFFRLFAHFSLNKKVEKLYDSINLYKKEKKCLFVVILISFVFQNIMILNRYILSLSIGMDVPLHFFFIFIPICSLITFLPISIGRIGVLEVLYLYFFTMVGATPAEAVSLAFLSHIFAFIQSLIGGGIYLISNASEKEIK